MIVKYKKNILKNALVVLVYVFAAVNVFLFNVVLHEYGHFAAADYYGLEPEIEFNLDSIGNLGFNLFSFESKTIASTSFIDNGDEDELLAVVLMGPFANLLFGVVFFLCLLFLKNYMLKELCIVGGVVSLASFLMNILPLDGGDGGLIFAMI